MRILIWQWGRYGAGPLFAMHLANALRSVEGPEVFLSLANRAEILQAEHAPHCDLLIDTYTGVAGCLWKLLQAPRFVSHLARQLAVLNPDIAICAMPGPLDLLHLAALRRLRIPTAVLVHDAESHPGDGYPFLMALQRQLTRRADSVVALSHHVASFLAQQGVVDRRKLSALWLPPLVFGPLPPPPKAHGGALRLLFFGRLLPYKGLHLLHAAVRELGPSGAWVLRVVGTGPECNDLDALRATPGVTVENRWVPDNEISALIAWADVVVLPYVEASQSGVAPAAIAAGRIVVGTRVGGLAEQLRDKSLARLCEPHATSLALVLRELVQELPNPALSPITDPGRDWEDFARAMLAQVIQPVLGHHFMRPDGWTADAGASM
jgi:glycosyltransferase involved in cell wall biosynthesis